MDKLGGYFVDRIDKNLILKTIYRILRFCSWSKSDTESALKSIQILRKHIQTIKRYLIKSLIQIDTCMQIEQTKSNDKLDIYTLFNSL